MTSIRFSGFTLAILAALLVALTAAWSGDEKSGVGSKEMRPVLDKAVAYLKTSQKADGSFSPKFGPGITGVVVAGLLRCGHGADEPIVAKGIKYLESKVKDDGGIYDKGLANYTTSVAIMAFHEANKGGKYDTILKNASAFLKGIPDTSNPKDPKFGGTGYT